jgi:Zn-finger nucleic acid-binding protein
VTEAYREAALSCPSCRETLDPAVVHDATIDVCGACGGVWVDWFDGDLVQLVRGAPKTRPAGLADYHSVSLCPRCHQVLKDERYHESRADVLRCPDCAGVFVPRASLGAVASLADTDAQKPPRDTLAKLADTLQRWLGWRET